MSALEAHAAHEPSADAEAVRLFHAHSGEILAFCRRQLGSGPEAEDALQTTFLYVLRALRRGVVPECEGAWLTTIARNVCHTQRRTLGRRGSLSTDLDLDRIALARPEPDEGELLAGLQDALASLPDRQRRAIVLREWQGLGLAEIASRLDLTTTATNALLTRARHSLAVALTATVRGPLSALNVGVLADALRVYLKGFLGGAASKAAVAAVAVTVSVGVGGVVVDRSLRDGPATPTGNGVEARQSPAAGAMAKKAALGASAKKVAASPARARPRTRGARQVVTPSGGPVGTVADPPRTGPMQPPTTPGAPVDPQRPSASETGAKANPRPDVAPRPSIPELPPLLPGLGLDPALPPVELPPVQLPGLPPLPALPLDEQDPLPPVLPVTLP